MKQKGVREPPSPGVRHHETTHGERLKVITSQDEAGMSWAEIGRRLDIRESSAKGSTTSSLVPLKTFGIDRFCPDIPQSKRSWHSIESETIWSPCILQRCRETRTDCFHHLRPKNLTPLLGRIHHRDGLCMLSKGCPESCAVYGIPQARTSEEVQCTTGQQTSPSPVGPGAPLMDI